LRLCALSLRVAQARFLAARTGRKPILLLDDVLLELDPQRKRAFIARFPPYEQAFFTFLPDESWQTYRTDATLVLAVEQGDFRR
jgi:DNA replication and repair protein RecF